MFDQWCEERQIRGNWREALYHHIMASRSEDQINDPEEWAAAWKELMEEYSSKIGETE